MNQTDNFQEKLEQCYEEFIKKEQKHLSEINEQVNIMHQHIETMKQQDELLKKQDVLIAEFTEEAKNQAKEISFLNEIFFSTPAVEIYDNNDE